MNQLIAHLRHRVPDGVIRVGELRAAGVSGYALSSRCRPSGPWQRVLPGVVLLSGAEPTRRQQLRAALAYAGASSVITGADALQAHGLTWPGTPEVFVLLPAGRRLAGRSYLIVERTARLPPASWVDGFAVAPVVRATIDLARREHDRDRLRALLLAVLRAGMCTATGLLAELDAGNQRGSAGPRQMLGELERHQYSSGSLPSMSRT